MSEGDWENEGGSWNPEDNIVLTPQAIEAVKTAEDFYKQGYSLEQIADWLGFREINGDKTISLRLLMAVANHTGVLD